MRPFVRHLLPISLLLVLTGCGGQPVHTEGNQPPLTPSRANHSQQQLLTLALQQQGISYRYGGSHPATGFDCSGLIQFSYRQIGKRIPRTTQAQYQASRPIPLSQILPGDLLFYETEGRRPGHVALYLGRGEMIHAPSSGKQVKINRLNNPYWRTRLLAAGRF